MTQKTNMTDQRQPLVSVVLAVYNADDYISEAVQSILDQTYSNFELIIVDDASTDRTSEILTRFADPRVSILRNETNLGPYGAANRGIAQSKGELIARHDADDISSPDRFARQVEAFQKNPNLVLAGSSYYIIDRNGRVIDLTNLPDTNEKLQKRLEQGNIFIQGATMFSRKAFEQVKGYREYFRVTMDYDLFLRLAEVGEIINLPEPLYKFRFHGESISRNKKELQLACRRLAWEWAVRRRSGLDERQIPEDVISAYPPEPERLFRDARGSAYLYYAAGQIEKAADSMARAGKYLSEIDNFHPMWDEWILSHANSLANVTGDLDSGANFIGWLVPQIAQQDPSQSAKKLLAEYYTGRAFQAYEANLPQKVPQMTLAAIKADFNLIKNRGLLAITLRSLFDSR